MMKNSVFNVDCFRNSLFTTTGDSPVNNFFEQETLRFLQKLIGDTPEHIKMHDNIDKAEEVDYSITHTDNGILLRIYLPKYSRENIQISHERGQLIISGHRNNEEKDGAAQTGIGQYQEKNFKMVFNFGNNFVCDADFGNDLLEVRLKQGVPDFIRIERNHLMTMLLRSITIPDDSPEKENEEVRVFFAIRGLLALAYWLKDKNQIKFSRERLEKLLELENFIRVSYGADFANAPYICKAFAISYLKLLPLLNQLTPAERLLSGFLPEDAVKAHNRVISYIVDALKRAEALCGKEKIEIKERVVEVAKEGEPTETAATTKVEPPSDTEAQTEAKTA